MLYPRQKQTATEKPIIQHISSKSIINPIILIHHKRRLAFYFKTNRTEINGDNLKECEIECGKAIREFANTQWNEFLKRMGPSPLSSVPFWRRLNRLRGNKRSTNIATLEENGIKYTKDSEKAEILADRLEKIFGDDDNNEFDKTHFDSINNSINRGEFSNLYTEREKKIKPLSMQELVKGMKKINSKTSTDQDGISNKILKNVSDNTKELILCLFNKCLELKKVPAYWKISSMNMILKKGSDSKKTKSYRPISITPCIARLFERLILARLKTHLTQNNILIAAQSGFRTF